MRTIYTLGYEGATLVDFIQTLQKFSVSTLLDVRELPQSRRPGFSKKALMAALAEVGIGYQHWRQLGDPKEGRDAARRGDMDRFRAIFNAHLDLPATQSALQEVAQIAARQTVALMCFERAACDCHRALVANRLLQLRSLKVANVGVQPQKAIGRPTVGAIPREHD